MGQLALLTRDRTGRYWSLNEAKNPVFSTGENGFMLASWSLERSNRGLTFAWEDLSLNNQVYFQSSRGDLAWHGRLESVQLSASNGVITITCTATGYWASTYDRIANGTIGTSGTLGSGTTPEAMLGNILPYASQLSSSVTGFVATGLTSQSYSTPDGGTTSMRVGDILLGICNLGTSTTGDRIIPMVLEGRQLITRRLPATPVAAYSVSLHNLASFGVLRNLSAIYNRVQVRYKSSTDSSLQIAAAADAAIQTAQGVDYTGVAGVTDLLRITTRDITGLQETTSTVATTLANTVLNQTKRVKNEVQSIVISRDYAITDTTMGQEIPNWAVRAGCWLKIPDLFDRASDPADSGVGTTLGDEALQTLFYISETSYEVETGKLTITPGAGSILSGSDGSI